MDIDYSELLISSSDLSELGRQEPRQTDLNPNTPLDRLILDEIHAFGTWTDLEIEAFYTDGSGTRSVNDPDNHGIFIRIDRLQLGGLFKSLSPEAVKTGIYFVLGHEAGHCLQYKVLGRDWVNAQKANLIEAHADALAGIWLGRRIGTSSQIPAADIVQVCKTLISDDQSKYPTAFQRARIAEKGLSLEAGSTLLLEQLSLRELIRSTDITDEMRENVLSSFHITKKYLATLPPDEPIFIGPKEVEASMKIKKPAIRRKTN